MDPRFKITGATVLLVGIVVLLTLISYFQIKSVNEELGRSERSLSVTNRNYDQLRARFEEICKTETLDNGAETCEIDIIPEPEEPSDGFNGQDGADGDVGPRGIEGPQGPRGEQGPDGPRGPQGDDGENGANGGDGLDGGTGAPGDPGAAGTNGADGAQGPAGPPGTTGPQGPAGQDGVDGKDGTDGVDGVATCPDGTQADVTTVFVYQSADPLDQNRVPINVYAC